MIRLPPRDILDRLKPIERFGLGVLLDCSRLLAVDDPAADVVRLSLGSGEHTTVSDGEVAFPRARLAQLAEFAAGAGEQRSTASDRVGRVPPSENALVKLNHIRDPAVSREGPALRKAVEQAAGRRPVRGLAPWPAGRRWAVAMTHDLDLVANWFGYTLLRVTELASRLRLWQAAEALANGLAWLGRNPVWQGVSEVLTVEREFELRATWFVICGTPTLATMRAGDISYAPESAPVQRILEAVAAAGHEVGLHGSFETMLDAGKFREQRDRLGRLAAAPATGVRQHFLRMRPGATHREMAAAGFSYDATWGFSDRNGFRLGVADIIPGWDAEREALSGLDEAPLIWMDRALSKHRGVDQPDRWVDDALELAKACREVNGAWVGLWHPNLTPPLGFPRAPGAFRRLVEVLMGGQPYADRLDRLVSWRAARRSVRATRIRPDGSIELRADRKWDGPAVIEDFRGGLAQSQSWPGPRG